VQPSPDQWSKPPITHADSQRKQTNMPPQAEYFPARSPATADGQIAELHSAIQQVLFNSLGVPRQILQGTNEADHALSKSATPKERDQMK